MAMRDYALSERFFQRAVNADPTRAEYYFCWGECLRWDGKPGAAAQKYRDALLRNDLESSEAYFQTKLWLAEIQDNSETASGDGAKIDAALASTSPSGAPLVAGAARDIRDGKYIDASDKLHRASERIEPILFRRYLQDPVFSAESWRPEFEDFFRPAKIKPMIGPAAAPSPSP